MITVKASMLLLLTALAFMQCSAGLPVDESNSEGSAEGSAQAALPAHGDEIPLDFYRELDQIDDVSEFIAHFVQEDTIDPKLGIQENLKRSVERSAAVIPRAAHCTPENALVSLAPLNPSKDPKVIYYPKCTRVKRCSGCCSSELMSCQAVETEVINFEITKYRYGERAPLVGREVVPIEQHVRCRCDCRIKSEDCNAYQLYRPELCRCECINDDAREKCLQQDKKVWDENTCKCVCPDSQNCTTGTYFDETHCACVDQSAERGSSVTGNTATILDRRRFIVKAIPVEPDNSTIYSF